MNDKNNTDHSNDWQALQARLHELVARYPMMGISPDSVPMMRPDEVIGNYNFLTNHHAKVEG